MKNGYVVDYEFDNKNFKYYTDFYLPQYKILVELKDWHIWHKKQIESGKWSAKMEGVETFISNNDMTYSLVFPENFDEFLKSLEKV